MPTATIDVTINNGGTPIWFPLLSPSGAVGSTLAFSPATYELLRTDIPTLPSGNDGLSCDSAGNIKVFMPMNLKFRFPQFSPDADTAALRAFYPIGIGYYALNDGALAASDVGSLPRSQVTFGSDVDGNNAGIPWIQLQDSFTTIGKENKADWDYYIIVQDNFGSFGAVDPEVDNESQN